MMRSKMDLSCVRMAWISCEQRAPLCGTEWIWTALYVCACVCACMRAHRRVLVDEDLGDDGVEERLVRRDDAVEVLCARDALQQLVPRARQHLEVDVVLHLLHEVHHLGGEHVALVQHRAQLCRNQSRVMRTHVN